MQKNLSSQALKQMQAMRRAEWYQPEDHGAHRLSRQKVLARFRKLAEKSPVARAALDWAAQNNVQFINRLSCTGGRAAYLVGSGIIALSWLDLANPFTRSVMLNTLVHEIRHAWQDYMGLDVRLNPGEDISHDWRRGMMQTALLEADASAHGELAMLQVRDAQVASGACMERFFWKWFNDYGNLYGQGLVDEYREAIQSDSEDENDQSDRPAFGEHTRPGIDPFRHEEMMKLGRMFGGGNYMPRIDRARLYKTALSGAFANALYTPDEDRNAPEVIEVRRYQLKEKLKTPLKRLPLPGGAT